MAEGIAGGAGGGDPGIAPAPPQEQQQNLIESFRAITSSASAEALFFLESHAWQLDAAVQSFFDTDDDDDSAPPLPPTAVAAPAPAPAAPSRRRRRRLQEEEEDEGDADADDEDYVPPLADDAPPPRLTSSAAAAMASSSGSGAPSRGSGGRPAGGIRTLADLNRRSGNGSGSNTDDDSDGPQEYYTGGEKSGMLVQDPSKGNPNIDDIFEQARQTGEVVHEPIEQLRASSSSKTFTGTGRLLSGETVQVDPQPPESVVHDVVFWTNGFTVNDGPLRRFNDPENAAFLESIKRSECPRELEPADRRTAVHVSLSRREEKCPEPAKRFNPFGGVGRTLGAGSSASSAAPEDAPASAALTGAPPPSAAGLYVDDSLPSTSIQLRLADGTRMVARFNNHHTVGDIRGFIDASRPGATRSYQLQTVGFPPKQLTDVTQTIEQAGLANSVVIQKL